MDVFGLRGVSPFQGFLLLFYIFTQGFALGYRVAPLWGEKQDCATSKSVSEGERFRNAESKPI